VVPRVIIRGSVLKNIEITADKVRCGQKHFEALGVPFDVAVTADEV
jgi:type III restriction enzyme